MIDKDQTEQASHIEVEYSRGEIIYEGVKITLKKWLETEKIRYNKRLVKIVETELTSPQELAGYCIIVLGYVNGPCMPWSFAEPIASYSQRKELSDLIKKEYSSKALFHTNGKSKKV